MTQDMNIIFISYKVCLDCIGQSLKADIEQTISEDQVSGNRDNANCDSVISVSALFNTTNKYIGHTNRIVLTNATGAVIAYMGLPKHAMLMATNMLNELISANTKGLVPLSGRIGIHSEPANALYECTNKPNFIDNGINKARQLMHTAQFNEIVVSRSYYENIPQSYQVLSILYDDIIDEYDQNLLDYQAYLASSNRNIASANQTLITKQSPILGQVANLNQVHAPDQAYALDQTHNSVQTQSETLIQPSYLDFIFYDTRHWMYAFAGLLVTVGLFSIVKLASAPIDFINKTIKDFPIKATQTINLKRPVEKYKILEETPNAIDKEVEKKQKNSKPIISKKMILTKKGIKQKTLKITTPITKKSISKAVITKKPNSWETLKNSILQGKKIECTQPQIAMNQCQ